MAAPNPQPQYLTGTFYSDCPTLELGCCVRVWDPEQSQYFNADDGRGSYFSDGTWCYKIENCLIVEKRQCPTDLYVRACSDLATDSNGILNLFAWLTTGPNGGSMVGANTQITVQINVAFVDPPGATASGQVVIGLNYVQQLPISYGFIDLGPTYANKRVASIQIASIDPTVWQSSDPVPILRNYWIGEVCTYDAEYVDETPPPDNGLVIDQYTAINIMYSMGTNGFEVSDDKVENSKQVLKTLKDSAELKNCLLPLYGNDINIYNYMVRVVDTKDLSDNFRERWLVMLTWTNIEGTLPPPPLQIPTTKKVVNILLQTEADDSYHSGCDRPRGVVPGYPIDAVRGRKQIKRWNQDLSALRSHLSTANSTNPYYWRGILNVLRFGDDKTSQSGLSECTQFYDMARGLMTGERIKTEFDTSGVSWTWVPGFRPGLQDDFSTVKYRSYDYPNGLIKIDFVKIIADSLQALGYPRPCP